MGTLAPVSSSCSIFVLGVYLMMRNASRLSDELSASEYRTTSLFIALAFFLILLAGVVNKVLE